MKTKVLVTGGCGFIGRQVVKQLLKENYYVRVVDDFSNSTPISKTNFLEVINFDLCNENGIYKIFKDIDYCIHLAARAGGIKFTNSSQSKILHDNLLIDANVLSFISKVRIRKIIYASTAIVYDRFKKLPFKEVSVNNLPIPKSNYGFAKLVGERFCQLLSQEAGLNYVIARIFNVYGVNPNTVAEEKLHVIPDLIRKISSTEKQLELYGEGRQKRTFVHVDDVASALIRCMESSKANNEIFNIASLEQFQILDLAKKIWKLLRKKDDFYIKNIPVLEEDFMESLADVSKMKKLIGWEAKKTMSESLPEIAKWYSKR